MITTKLGTVASLVCVVIMVSVGLGSAMVDDVAIAQKSGGQGVFGGQGGAVGQWAKSFDVLVTDENGTPVSGVVVTPWALRSSQGHGVWSGDESDPAELSPRAVTTNKLGIASVFYPFYRNVDEQTRVFSVSISLTHPHYTLADSVHVDVPSEGGQPHRIAMQRSASVRLILKSQTSENDSKSVFAVTSDPSTWPGGLDVAWDESSLTLSGLLPGPCEVMLVRIKDGKAIAFSDPQTMTLHSGENPALEMELFPARTIRGKLSDEVPRPVVHGRVSVMNLIVDPDTAFLTWADWAEVDAEGNFEIRGWPRSLTMQLIALSDFYIAQSGLAPEVVKRKRDPATDPFQRPQVFRPEADLPIEVKMEPLVRCEVRMVNEDGEPVIGEWVASSPNVAWWNWGSQIYGRTLVRSEEFLLVDDLQRYYAEKGAAPHFPHPAEAIPDDQGRAILHLPSGHASLNIRAKDYQLPIFMGRRRHRITLEQGRPRKVTLQLEPSGRERLGEYDKLAGVVFGCSTREGRRICALPEVRKKMDDFAERLRAAKNPRDPKVLSEAYGVVAEAFERAGDAAEAAKWREKADAERAKG